MKQHPLLRLKNLGQSVWIDYIQRGMLCSGELRDLIEHDGISGLTSNPAIFEKAITGSRDYSASLRFLSLIGKSAKEIYEALTIEDIQRAADLFTPVYERTHGTDGLVSIEVSPHLAYDASLTIAEARRLWELVHRPNVMIKVPATMEGIHAIRTLIAEGINVNVTLLFSVARYCEAAYAYLDGLEQRHTNGLPLNTITSVASFFLSRIDVMIDRILDELANDNQEKRLITAALKGKAAIACARLAYQKYQDIFSSDRFRALRMHGALPQRLLWASTSTKNPEYSDVMYIEPLIGPDTITTMPPETISAYRDHGDPALRLTEGIANASILLQQLSDAGIDLERVSRQLEAEGVEKFIRPYDLVLTTIEEHLTAARYETINQQRIHAASLNDAVTEQLHASEIQTMPLRLWRKDPCLWIPESGTDAGERAQISNALGWLDAPERMYGYRTLLRDIASEITRFGFRKVVDIGMGGSTLAPMAFGQIFAQSASGVPLRVLDTTDPASILKLEQSLSLTDTLFLVASKSGTTVESDALAEYFYKQVTRSKGPTKAGEHFIAITDPGTPLARIAAERGFRRIILNFHDIGGRYSALSFFGLLPAALVGIDTEELLIRAQRMAYACQTTAALSQNPGCALGIALGVCTLAGRDKLTFFMPESIKVFGMWLEQLLAESTGKKGKGIVPVVGEPPGPPSVYDQDRTFVCFQFKDDSDRSMEPLLQELTRAGHPVISIFLDELIDLGQEFFRWEVATAIAGSLLNINPFDQPNVQEAKDTTKRLLSHAQEKGDVPKERPAFVHGPLEIYTEHRERSFEALLTTFLSQVQRGDYFALLAYLTEETTTEDLLQKVRIKIRDTLRVATTLGYGPRYLHSTGQLHKGGPNTGVFLMITADDAADMSVPGKSYTFGLLKRAQALGDLKILRTYGRRVLRVHIRGDVADGLQVLWRAMEEACAGL